MARSYKYPKRVIKAVLTETESMVSVDEIRSFMRDALAHGTGLDAALERCFAGPGPKTADSRQMSRFGTAIAQFWDEEASGFDAKADKAIAPVRDSVLVYVEMIATWIRSLDERLVALSDLPSEPLETLAMLSSGLSAILELLNREADPDPTELAGLHEQIHHLGPPVEGLISEVEQAIAAAGTAGVFGRPDAPPSAVYVLKIVLDGSDPRIWRRVRVPGNATLGDLHAVIQAAMGWWGDHLHLFVVGRESYVDTEDIDDPDAGDEFTTTLDSLELRPRGRFRYVYDLGDNWSHTITVEKRLDPDSLSPAESSSYECLGGERACPPEDCGGVHGYARLLNLLQKPRERLDAYDLELFETYADDFDPHEFDRDHVNQILRGETSDW